MNKVYNLYAVMVDGVVRRIRLEHETQLGVSAQFDSQLATFLPKGYSAVDYEPLWKPDDDDPDEVIRISDFHLPDNLSLMIEQSEAVSNLSVSELKEGNIRAIAAVTVSTAASAWILFQTFDRRQVLQKGLSIVFEKDRFSRISDGGLTLGSRLAAVYRDQALLFRSEWEVRRFVDLGDLFEEATDEHIKELLALPGLSGNTQGVIDVADTWMRRRIMMIIESKILETVSISRLVKVSKGFGLNLTTSKKDGKVAIEVPVEKAALKELIRFLNQDLLSSEMTDDKFRVGAKRKLKVS